MNRLHLRRRSARLVALATACALGVSSVAAQGFGEGRAQRGERGERTERGADRGERADHGGRPDRAERGERAAPPAAVLGGNGREGGREGFRDGGREGGRDFARDGGRDDPRGAPLLGTGRPDHGGVPPVWGAPAAGGAHAVQPRPPVVVPVPAPVPAPPARWVDGSPRHWVGGGAWSGPRHPGPVVVTRPHAPIVVRPHHGVVVRSLPDWRTVLVVGGLTYLLVNGIYYRERAEGGYISVPSPVEAEPSPLPALVPVPGLDRQYVYPRQGQSAQQQAADEYDCHRWAVQQTGFDPSQFALDPGQPLPPMSVRADYLRARGACLDARGYTVR